MSLFQDPDPPPEESWWVRARGTLTGLGAGAVVLYVLVTGGSGLGNWVNSLDGLGSENEPIEVEAGITRLVVIPPGSSARTIAGILTREGVVSSAVEFEARVRTKEAGELLKAGTYELVTGTDPDEIVDLLIAGPTLNVFRVTVIEGLRLEEILEVLAGASGSYSKEDFSQALTGGEVESSYLPERFEGSEVPTEAWEGLLFPATYEFFNDAPPAEILQRMSTEMEDRLSRYDWVPVTERGYSVYQGLVMASLIEAEAAVDEDRPLIAGVINNRLEIGMPLQIDATVLYALGDRGRSPTLDDLEYDSPYNTYQVGGLPPTPIGAPGAKSIEAVLDPSIHEYLFYVLTSEDGSHSFFREYEDFLEAKNQAEDLFQDG
ncbi:MAG: endolytic transglycosylase MltG [bacterium]|nr:endolytic transglycosylase MltG [bacterium]MYH55750.1 endolytic transglycosylase MltG [Acidimicrobiia bacterium]